MQHEQMLSRGSHTRDARHVSDPSRTILSLKGVSKTYRVGGVEVHAVRDVDLTIERGDFAALVGPSGSGKSTLLHLLGCLDVPERGSIQIDQVETSRMNDAQQSELRSRRIGFVFQAFNLIPVLNVLENVELPLLILPEVTREERRQRVRDVVEAVGLYDHAMKLPDRLSGGQRQRVAIARALVTNPAIILADEPTANLDSETALRIVDLMAELNASRGATFLFSTHDERLMTRVKRLIRLKDGRIAD